VTFNNLIELSQLNLSKEPIMGRNSAQQSPAPQRSEDRPPPPAAKKRTNEPPSRPSASTQRQSTAPAKPEVERGRGGNVKVPYGEVKSHHLEAMADDQLVKHWQKTSTDPTTQRKGMGGVDLDDRRVSESMDELRKRKIDPFQTTGPSSKGNKFDQTGKMDQKFYQANKDPKTGYIIPKGKKGSGGSMEQTKGKSRPMPPQNERPPGASPRS
jgi:hypothetical protein